MTLPDPRARDALIAGLDDPARALAALAGLKARWICISSLFHDGPVESDIHGQQGRYGAIVSDQFTGVGKLVPVLALDLGGIPATIQGRILLGLRQHLVIGHEESIPALRPDGMLHRPFPDHAAHAGSTRLVLCERANVLDATCTDENATGAFHKGHMFGVEETKGILRAEMTGEGVE